MYQKGKERQNKDNINKECLSKVVINCSRTKIIGETRKAL